MIYILLLSHVVKYCYCLAVYGCGFLTLPLTSGVLGALWPMGTPLPLNHHFQKHVRYSALNRQSVQGFISIFLLSSHLETRPPFWNVAKFFFPRMMAVLLSITKFNSTKQQSVNLAKFHLYICKIQRMLNVSRGF